MTKSQIINLLSDDSITDDLAHQADIIRHNSVGDAVHLRALIEFSSFCRNDCFYCGLRHSNSSLPRYRLSPEQILQSAISAKYKGFKTIVLQSGDDLFFDTDSLVSIIKSIKSLNLALTLSIGERSFDDYKAFKSAGADRFLLRIETSDVNLYHYLHPHQSWHHRLQCLKNLKSLGFEVGSGSLIGLPNQSIDSLADDILLFQSLDLDMIGVGPFIAHPSTPLNSFPNGNLMLTRRFISICRILMPSVNIPATTAVETLLKGGRNLFLQSGCNVFMPNFTPTQFRNLYSLYPNKISSYDSIPVINDNLKSIHRFVSDDFGFRINLK